MESPTVEQIIIKDQISQLPEECSCMPEHVRRLILFAVEEKLLQVEHAKKIAEDFAQRYQHRPEPIQASYDRDVEHYKELEKEWRLLADVIRNKVPDCETPSSRRLRLAKTSLGLRYT